MTALKIAVSGAKGFIGSKLCMALRESGHEVVPMVRTKKEGTACIFYDYENKYVELDKLAKCHAVIHLAGRNIMSGVWTEKVKKEIYDSRVKSTRFLSHSLARMDNGPKILLTASAVGIYGDQSDLKLDEDSHAGIGFLAKLCVDWERGTLFAKNAGLRVVNMRFGNVLDRDGGMLKLMAPIFRLGWGSVLGSGEQYMSYVTRDQLVNQILFLLPKSDIAGPVNMVAAEPTTNLEFSKALAKIFHRRAFLRMPVFLLKLLGDQGAMLLASTRAYPRVLMDSHFPFAQDHSIEKALAGIYNN